MASIMSDEEVLCETRGSFATSTTYHPFVNLLTMFLYPILLAFRSSVVVTDRRLIINNGIISLSNQEIVLDEITGTETRSLRYLWVIPVGSALVVNTATRSYLVNTNDAQQVREAITRVRS